MKLLNDYKSEVKEDKRYYSFEIQFCITIKLVNIKRQY